ncbi:MAG: hypothetical protein Q8920_14710 [Bacillota bacterium]|nr:hypothetical protein [Bacillota bacterium]
MINTANTVLLSITQTLRKDSFELIGDFGLSMLEVIIQIVAGCIIAFGIYKCFKKRVSIKETAFLKELIIILFSTLIGMILPLGVYGIIPIAAVLLFLGFRLYTILPMIFSNVLFTILIPFNDPTFVWRTGYRRVILAFAAGLLIGVVCKAFKSDPGKFLREGNMPDFTIMPAGIKGILNLFTQIINKAGLYVIFGIIIDTLFHKYLFWKVIDFIFTNPNTSFIPKYFAGLNVVNPFFLLTMAIARMLMGFITMSALLAFFKPRGWVLYYGYYLILAVLLGISAFF